MKAVSTFVRGGLVASLACLLTACAGAGFPDFGGSTCRTVYVLSGGVVQPVNTCGGVPREGLMAQKSVAVMGDDLAALLAAPKFEADAFYAGVDTPAVRTALTAIVDGAIRDVIALPEPRNPALVQSRLKVAVQALEAFATKDREHAHRYLVLAWKAAGFTGESGLLPAPDEDVLSAS